MFVNAVETPEKFEEKEEFNPLIAEENVDFNIPFLQNDFVGFKEAVAFKESQGKYGAVNTLGYLGKYQFGRTTLERFRIYNTDRFLKDPAPFLSHHHTRLSSLHTVSSDNQNENPVSY